MIRSMTGFGQAGRIAHGYKLQADLKSVNHRYCEIVIRMPREWMALEDSLRKIIGQAVKRGRVDMFVQIERETSIDKSVEIDWSLAEGYLQAAEQIRNRFSFSDPLSLKELLLIPDLVKFRYNSDEPIETIGAELAECIQQAVVQLVEMRETEGQHLYIDLLSRVEIMETHYEWIRQAAPAVVKEYRHKLRHRIEELLSDTASLDESRLAMEVALYADRSNIDEELTRLQSHFMQCRQLLHAEEPVGRKLDFLIQEMNREVNTIGSKANHPQIAGKVIEMKAELEKIREQVQNIE